MKKGAVIGLGDISGIHIGAMLLNPEIHLVAVCDVDESKKDQAPEGTTFYTDYEEMIRLEQPDVVHICLPHYLHAPISKAVALMGSHVFCEKPVAMNTKEALELEAFEAEHPEVRIGICLQNRFNESVCKLKELIDSGKDGKVVGTKGMVPWARSKSYYDCKPWRGKWETAGGGCMINQSVHTLDLLYYLGGSITGIKATVSQLLDYGIQVEDTVTAHLTYESGAKGLFFATNANYKNENVQISVQLEAAEYAIIDNMLYQLEEDGTKTLLAEDARVPGTKFYYGASHQKMIAGFYQALERGSQDYLHVRDAVMSIQLIDAIQESGRTGKRITL